jgi:hypothetical protein
MSHYIFLDNWVLSLLRDPEVATGLTRFISSNGLTVLLTSLSMVELYNPGWQNALGKERGATAVHFLAGVPCVIVNPLRVWEEEIAARLSPLPVLPLELDLYDLPKDHRSATLLGFLRRDERFLQQGKDIQRWSLVYKETKLSWLSDANTIIENACRHGYLKRDKAGKFKDLEETRENFLYSLDFRLADPHDVGTILEDQLRLAQSGRRPDRLTSVRFSSLCFWYSYVDIDPANWPKHQDSDIGDFYHLSLLPYCSVFTADGTMYNMLQRIRERVPPVNCEVMTKRLLEKRIRQYA